MSEAQQPPIQLRIVSDGTPAGTYVEDIHTGRRIQYLQGIELEGTFTERPMIVSAKVQFILSREDGSEGQPVAPGEPIINLIEMFYDREWVMKVKDFTREVLRRHVPTAPFVRTSCGGSRSRRARSGCSGRK